MLIKNNEDLINLCKLFKNKKVLFIDTEFDRKNTYFSKLSYITIYDGTRFWIIDALSNLNLNILKIDNKQQRDNKSISWISTRFRNI